MILLADVSVWLLLGGVGGMADSSLSLFFPLSFFFFSISSSFLSFSFLSCLLACSLSTGLPVDWASLMYGSGWISGKMGVVSESGVGCELLVVVGGLE